MLFNNGNSHDLRSTHSVPVPAHGVFLMHLCITDEAGIIIPAQIGFASPTCTQQSGCKAGTRHWRLPEGWGIDGGPDILLNYVPALPPLLCHLLPFVSSGSWS